MDRGAWRATVPGVTESHICDPACPSLSAVFNIRFSIPGSGRSPGEGKGYPLPYSGLENSMDWIVHGVAKSRIRLSDFHFTQEDPKAQSDEVACPRSHS